MKALSLVLLTGCGLLLSACNFGDSDATPPPDNTTVPASAQVSTAAWTSYTGALPSSDSADPVDVNNATPPVSETDEPQAI